MQLQKIHHVAYRCRDAKETVAFYNRVMGMELIGAIAEDRVPSTKAPDPYMHIFLDAGAGNILAFFELPNSPPMGRDPNTPDWVQHIAFQVGDLDALNEAKARAEADGLDVVGPTDHTIFRSIYFRDPSGHRLEVAAWTATAEQMAQMKDVAHAMVDEWAETKKPPRHTAWLHQKEFESAE
ncbi:VOC family protein [Rhodopseudomonas sp. B29]|uniref:VOC family protein n=1 Tax=Rhodopseudomonas sp. B29 TaxID=95607 RepID=UPI00034D244E|nr:VOC family protein [Rhodopseudomonas sp. B29]